MITDAQVFTALVIALISGILAIRLGTKLYV
jgi:photosystem I reaction center subunit XII